MTGSNCPNDAHSLLGPPPTSWSEQRNVLPQIPRYIAGGVASRCKPIHMSERTARTTCMMKTTNSFPRIANQKQRFTNRVARGRHRSGKTFKITECQTLLSLNHFRRRLRITDRNLSRTLFLKRGINWRAQIQEIPSTTRSGMAIHNARISTSVDTGTTVLPTAALRGSAISHIKYGVKLDASAIVTAKNAANTSISPILSRKADLCSSM